MWALGFRVNIYLVAHTHAQCLLSVSLFTVHTAEHLCLLYIHLLFLDSLLHSFHFFLCHHGFSSVQCLASAVITDPCFPQFCCDARLCCWCSQVLQCNKVCLEPRDMAQQSFVIIIYDTAILCNYKIWRSNPL